MTNQGIILYSLAFLLVDTLVLLYIVSPVLVFLVYQEHSLSVLAPHSLLVSEYDRQNHYILPIVLDQYSLLP